MPPFSVTPLSGANQFQIKIVVPDFLGLLSLITGLFASSGINIANGEIRTTDKKAVDVFEVTCEKSVDWPAFEKKFNDLMQKVFAGGLEEVRFEVNRRIIGFLRGKKESRLGSSPLEPIHLQIDQGSSETETRLDISAQDTPAFLFELTNALSLLGINIVRMEIKTVGDRVEDRLWVTGETGEKIISDKKIKALQWAVLLMKQFTHLLPKVPDPKAALEQMTLFGKDLFERSDFSEVLLTLRKSQILEDLSKVFGTSRFLWEEFIRTQHESIFPILSDHKVLKIKKDRELMLRELQRLISFKKSFEEKVQALNEFKDREIFRIDLRHILGRASYLGEFAEEFTDLAEAVVEAAYGLAREELVKKFPPPRVDQAAESECAILALGKFGGRELGYASDLELLFVYADPADSASPQSQQNLDFYCELVRAFTHIIHARAEGVFEIDLRLRPHGRNGPLAVSMPFFKKYYSVDGDAWNFERQALVKLRRVAGSQALGCEAERHRDEFVYGRQPFDFYEAIHLRDRQRRELVAKGTMNAKYSAGGLLDLEFLVQILQIVYGREQAGDIRHPNTLKALRALWQAGAMPEKEFQMIRASYIFLRSLINALRIVRGNAKDLTIPKEESDAFVILARRIGFQGDDGDVRKKFSTALEHHRNVAEKSYETRLKHLAAEPWESAAVRVEVPKAAARVSLDDLLCGELSESQQQTLGMLGFQYIPELTERLRRLCPGAQIFEPFARIMDKTWPVWPKVPDPDLAVLHLERFVESISEKDVFWERLVESEKGLQVLLTLFGSSRYLSELLIANPGDLEWIEDEKNLSVERTLHLLEHEKEKDFDLESLRRFRHRETLRIALAEMFAGSPLAKVAEAFAALADFVLEKILKLANVPPQICVIGLGKLGGRELNFSSDIDLMFVAPHAHEDAAIPAIQRMLKTLKEGGPEDSFYRVDLRLRPHGQDGKLMMGFDDSLHYYQREADSWEYQMLIKARPVAGNLSLGRVLIQQLDPLIFREQWSAEAIEKIRGIKRRYEELNRSRDEADTNVKMGPGGIRDSEFTVQLLQLLNGARIPSIKIGNHLEALRAVRRAKLLPSKDCETIGEAYEFNRRIENRLQLYENRQIFNIPRHDAGVRILAKSMGFEDRDFEKAESQFYKKFLSLRAACRQIFERVFYRSNQPA